jgi:hypothetical protein
MLPSISKYFKKMVKLLIYGKKCDSKKGELIFPSSFSTSNTSVFKSIFQVNMKVCTRYMAIKKINDMTIVDTYKFPHKFSMNEESLNFSKPFIFFTSFFSSDWI